MDIEAISFFSWKHDMGKHHNTATKQGCSKNVEKALKGHTASPTKMGLTWSSQAEKKHAAEGLAIHKIKRIEEAWIHYGINNTPRLNHQDLHVHQPLNEVIIILEDFIPDNIYVAC